MTGFMPGDRIVRFGQAVLRHGLSYGEVVFPADPLQAIHVDVFQMDWKAWTDAAEAAGEVRSWDEGPTRRAEVLLRFGGDAVLLSGWLIPMVPFGEREPDIDVPSPTGQAMLDEADREARW